MLSMERIIDNDIRNYFEVMPEDWVKFSPKFKKNLAKLNPKPEDAPVIKITLLLNSLFIFCLKH